MNEIIWIIIWFSVIIVALVMMFSWRWIHWNIIKRFQYKHSKPKLYEFYFGKKKRRSSL